MKCVVALCAALLCFQQVAGAQPDLAQLLQLLNQLQAQVQSVQETLTLQAAQLGELGQQTSALSIELSQAKGALARVSDLEGQLAPLLDQTFSLQQRVAPLLAGWPAVQEALNTIAALQGGFNEQLAAVAQLRKAVDGLGAPADDARIGALQTQITALQGELNSARNREAVLGQRLDAQQAGAWGALVLAVVALAAQWGTWFVRRRRTA